MFQNNALGLTLGLSWAGAILMLAAMVLYMSWHVIRPGEVGAVRKRFGKRPPEGAGLIAVDGVRGYHPRPLVHGRHFRLWPLYAVTRHPPVHVPRGERGIVIAQVGETPGAVAAPYRKAFGSFEDVEAFLQAGGCRGLQSMTIPGGSVLSIHPVAFLVITTGGRLYGVVAGREYFDYLGGKQIFGSGFLTKPRMRRKQIPDLAA